jgi:hypothetical protein
MSGNPKLPTLGAWRRQRAEEAERILGQLPEIAEPEFTLVWDLEDASEAERRWTVRHGNQVIYRESARYEDYHRFELIARVLRQKYGRRVRDLVPADNPDLAYYLYGDFLGGPGRVEAARKRNFGLPQNH